MSHRIAAALLAAGLFSGGLLSAGSAFAAARTYVASYGNDANAATNCGPTAPCRTFAAAMPVTDTGGEVIVLDSAGYGSVAIAQSVSIIAPDGIYAGLTAASGDVVTIATAGVSVVLKGLSIRGNATGNGINMTNGTKLHVENCEISGSSAGRGISITTAANVRVANSTVRDNQLGLVAGYGATVDIMHVQFANNFAEGIEVHGGSGGVTSVINISDTIVTGSTWCVDNNAGSGTTGIINATRVTATGCGDGFVNEPLGSGYMVVSNSMAARNTTGFRQTSGFFFSMGNNHVAGNTTDTTGTITASTLR